MRYAWVFACVCVCVCVYVCVCVWGGGLSKGFTFPSSPRHLLQRLITSLIQLNGVPKEMTTLFQCFRKENLPKGQFKLVTWVIGSSSYLSSSISSLNLGAQPVQSCLASFLTTGESSGLSTESILCFFCKHQHRHNIIKYHAFLSADCNFAVSFS